MFYYRQDVLNPGERTAEKARKMRENIPLFAMKDVASSLGDAAKMGGNLKKALEQQQLERLEKEKSGAHGPTLNDVVETFSWHDVTEEMETMATRLHGLKSGEHLTVVGGGVSGLTLAYFVASSRPDVQVTVLEAEDRLGGYLETNRDAGPLFEKGPRTLLPGLPGSKVAAYILHQRGRLNEVAGLPKGSPVNKRGLLFGGRLHELPSSFGGALKFAFGSALGKGIISGAIRDLWSKPRHREINDESLESFISRRLSPHVARNLVSAVVRGIYGGDIASLSARYSKLGSAYLIERARGASITGGMFTGAASSVDSYDKEILPTLAQAMLDNGTCDEIDAELRKYSLLVFPNGIDSLTDVLSDALEELPNVTIKTGVQVKSLESAPGACRVVTHCEKSIDAAVVVSTVPAHRVAPMMALSSHRAPSLASQVPFSSIAVVNFHFDRKDISKPWFGFLVPKSEDATNSQQVIGVIFDSATGRHCVPLQPESPTSESPSVRKILEDQFDDGRHAPKHTPTSTSDGCTLTVMMGGPYWTSPESIPARDQILAQAESFLKQHLDATITPADYTAHVKVQANCIPQYPVNYADQLEALRTEVSHAFHNRLYLAGTSFGSGPGINDCIVDSILIASRFSDARKALWAPYYLNRFMTLSHPSFFA